MSFRFRRRIKIAPGVRLNLNKRSASLSLGGRGARMTVNRHGTRKTVGIPGSGVHTTRYARHDAQDGEGEWKTQFRHRVKVAPGTHVNLGKRGASVSAGPRGAKLTVGRDGLRQTVGVPGTGASWTRVSRPGGAAADEPAAHQTFAPAARQGWSTGRKLLVAFLILYVLFALLARSPGA